MSAKREGRSMRTLWAWSDVSWAEFENLVSVLGVMKVKVNVYCLRWNTLSAWTPHLGFQKG